MRQFITRSITALPITLLSLSGLGHAAQAAVIAFNVGDQANFNSVFQINQARFDDATTIGKPPGANDSLGSAGDTKGINNAVIGPAFIDAGDILFAPGLPVTGILNSQLNASNHIVDAAAIASGPGAFCAPVDPAVQDAQIGECGRLLGGSGSSNSMGGGGLQDIGANPVNGWIKNIDSLNLPTTFANPWIRFVTDAATDPTGGSRTYDYTLTSFAFTFPPYPASGSVTGTFKGTGVVRQCDTALTCITAPYKFELTTQGLRDDGAGGDPQAGDFVSNLTTLSLSLEVASTPEPSSTLGFLAIGGLGLGAVWARKRRSK